MTALVLTILLTILWIGGIAIGYWHGGWRQVVVLAAVLLSYAVASEWAVPNGRDLSRQFHWGLARTTTAVGLLYLIGGTLLIGGLGSFALPRPSPLTVRERILGALMGVLNGGLLLALVLRIVRSYAFLAGGGQVLRTSALSRFLIEGIGYVLIAALALSVVAAIVGLFFARRRVDVEAPILDWPRPQVVSVPPQPQYADAPPVPVPVMASNPPPPPLVAPVAPEPVYATAPIIDWPSSPPPGTHEEPAVTLASTEAAPPAPVGTARSAETQPNDVALPNGSSLMPTGPVLPRRVEPPMLYPLAPLLAAQTRIAATNVPALVPPAVSAAPTQASPPRPETPDAPATPPPARARPITPPPGALQPAFVPPTVPRPPAPSPAPNPPEPAPAPPSASAAQPSDETVLPDVRARDAAPDDAPPPVVRELDEETEDAPPPVVREVEVTTQDVPVVAAEPSTPQPTPVQASVSPAIGGESESMQTPKATESALLPAVGPPPLPSVPPPLPGMPDVPSPGRVLPPVSEQPASLPETSRQRAGFARVAVARQPGGQAEQPSQSSAPQPSAPQPPQQPEPLQPPLPTGPRVHPCPVCGYPIRDHTRYCPNCGSRQRT